VDSWATAIERGLNAKGASRLLATKRKTFIKCTQSHTTRTRMADFMVLQRKAKAVRKQSGRLPKGGEMP
ncbi:MAG: hypothetical protein ACJARK_002104, partial [Marinobacter psychrophilus]|uniref:hypothetical protein n=1 Tax=Marinobacter psychrophilus TaxID=330734 RepID=UPI0039E3553D